MAKRFVYSFFVLSLIGCTPVFDPKDAATTQRETMKSVALTYGAQSGLAWKAEIINATLDAHAVELDKIYNFNSLMMKNNMLPPVLQESQNIMSADGYDKVRMADKEIQIVRPAQLVTSAPTWRDYLIMSYDHPHLPDASLYPSVPEERALWKISFERGWKQGVKQADAIFAQSLGMINRDFNGMVLYHSLLTQNMIAPAYTSKAKLGVTGDANIMRINDQIVRITEEAKLMPDHSEGWQAVVDVHD